MVDEAFAANVGTWLNFNQSSRDVKEQVLKSIRGGTLMFQEISYACNRILPSSFNSNHVWYGAFSSFNVLIGARAYTSNESFLAYIIVSEGKLQWVSMEDDLLNLVEWKPIRVVAKTGKVCIIDPHPEKVNPFWDIWVCDSKPLLELEWDPTEWWWRDANGKMVSFFDYSVKLGREFQRRRSLVMPAAAKVWLNNNMPMHSILAFWKWLWALQIPRKIITFRWLCVHYALPVLEWMHREEGTKTCSFCGLHLESMQHALWNCMVACSVWKRMLRLIDVAYGPNVITWGNVFWMDVNVDKHNYEREKILFTLQTRGRQVKDIPYSSSNRLNVDATVWATISSVVLWNIWIDRCKNVFQQIKQNLVHCVKEIWSMLISILKGQYDSFTGNEDMIFLKQQSFKGKWKDLLVFVERNDKMEWQYVPPRWLFPP